MAKEISENQLAEMSIEQLDNLYQLVFNVKKNKQEAAKATVKAEIEALAKAAGVDVADLFGLSRSAAVTTSGRRPRSPNGTTAPKIAKALPKYANPKDDKEVWSGRGRNPVWVKEYLAAGGNLADTELTDEQMVVWKAENHWAE